MPAHMILGHSVYCWRKVKPLLCLHYKKRDFLCSLMHIHRQTHPFWDFPALIISICLKLYETARSCRFEQNVKASFFFFSFLTPSPRLSDSYYATLHAPPPLTLKPKTQSLIQTGKSAEKLGNCRIKGLWPLLANAVDATVSLFSFIVLMNNWIATYVTSSSAQHPRELNSTFLPQVCPSLYLLSLEKYSKSTVTSAEGDSPDTTAKTQENKASRKSIRKEIRLAFLVTFGLVAFLFKSLHCLKECTLWNCPVTPNHQRQFITKFYTGFPGADLLPGHEWGQLFQKS